MNKEDYVSLDVAKLLKEKGFDEQCRYTYCGESEEDIGVSNNKNSSFPQDIYSMPTLYEAQKWLRNEKGLYVEVSYMNSDYYIYEILTIPKHDLIGLSNREPFYYKSYEQALNNGIKEGLKLITL